MANFTLGMKQLYLGMKLQTNDLRRWQLHQGTNPDNRRRRRRIRSINNLSKAGETWESAHAK
jgi:hypothetical protein